jgi:hypothetical protein
MPQFDYTKNALLLGQISSATPWAIDSYLNELTAQVSRIALGGSDDGTYTVQIVGPEGTFTGTFVASGDAITDIIDGLLASLNDNAVNPDFEENVATGVNADPNLDLTFMHEGITYTITFPSNPAGNMTVSNTTEPGGARIGLGLCMAQGAADDLAVPPTDEADFLLGITVRNINTETNDGIQTSEDGYPGGSAMSLLRQGECTVQTEGAVTRGGPVFVRHAGATAAAPLGSLSSTDDAETVQLPGARWRTSTTAAGLAVVTVNNP